MTADALTHDDILIALSKGNAASVMVVRVGDAYAVMAFEGSHPVGHSSGWLTRSAAFDAGARAIVERRT